LTYWQFGGYYQSENPSFSILIIQDFGVIWHLVWKSYIINRKSKILLAKCPITQKSWIFTSIIQDFQMIGVKILDYQSKIQDFARQMSNNSKILDFHIDNPRFSNDWT
jgi:hypothetical protein